MVKDVLYLYQLITSNSSLATHLGCKIAKNPEEAKKKKNAKITQAP